MRALRGSTVARVCRASSRAINSCERLSDKSATRIEVHERTVGAALGGGVAAGPVEEDVAHHGGGHGKEVRAVLPIELAGRHQPLIDFLNHVGGLQRAAFALVSQQTRGETPEFAMHTRDQLVQRLFIAGGPGPEQSRGIRFGRLGHEEPSLGLYDHRQNNFVLHYSSAVQTALYRAYAESSRGEWAPATEKRTT